MPWGDWTSAVADVSTPATDRQSQEGKRWIEGCFSTWSIRSWTQRPSAWRSDDPGPLNEHPQQLVVDIDSTIREVFGRLKQGAAFGYTKVLGYHPILATRADTGEILHARLRKGSANTARGTKRFVEELVARLRRAGATGKIIIRFDSGYWSNDTLKVLGRLGVSLHHGRAHRHKGRRRRHFEDRRVGVGRHRVPRRWRGDGGRVHLQGSPPHRAPHPAQRSAGDAVAQLAALRFLTDLEGTAVELDAFATGTAPGGSPNRSHGRIRSTS